MWELPGAGVETEVRARRDAPFQKNRHSLGSVGQEPTGKGWGTPELWEITFKHERMRRLGRSVLLFTPFVWFVILQGRKWLARLGMWWWLNIAGWEQGES